MAHGIFNCVFRIFEASLVAQMVESACNGGDPWVGKIPWRKRWQPTPVFLPGEFHGQRSLLLCICSLTWSHKELDMTEQLSLTHHCSGSLAAACRLLEHVGSGSLARDQTWAPTLGAWSLSH